MTLLARIPTGALNGLSWSPHRELGCQVLNQPRRTNIKNKGKTYRVADDIVGENTHWRTERSVLVAPPRTGLPGIKPAAADLLPKTCVGHSFRRSQPHRGQGERAYVTSPNPWELKNQIDSLFVAIPFRSEPRR